MLGIFFPESDVILRFTNFDKYILARGFDVNQNAEAMIPISGKGHNILHMDFLYEYDESSSKPQVWIYWVDFESDEKGHNGIYRIRPDGTQLEHVIKDGIGKSGLRGIAVDWVSQMFLVKGVSNLRLV